MSDYDGMTNADVMSADELAEYERDAELRLDAADEERALEEERARAAEHGADEDGDGDCHAEFIDGSWTYCGCPDCEQREADDAEEELDA
ncbi:hypothetical protein GPA10_24850 [Streptomyces sp. p1417]|uniref:Uncharacterized protein n=1 Tax=Streptomyces typhae TaxID=2681492 RepID=A0A6L6X2J0_9ACTN|nr:hypothetical protein [Streptomyces typhae]MVO87897.1 hypothetical protein [Streptomyces typhae]